MSIFRGINPKTKRPYKHGDSKTPEYKTWLSIKQRSKNNVNKSIICDRWENSYENFLEDMGRKPTPQHSLDRLNSEGIYEPSNCKWSTSLEQGSNKKTNRYITYKGEIKHIAEWERIYNLKNSALSNRLNRGWDIEKALLTPQPVSKSRNSIRKKDFPEYIIWKAMKQRCSTSEGYMSKKDYAGRGIKICERWLGKNGFKNFYSDMGPRPNYDYSIDRINVNGNYEKLNCRWSSISEQARNKRNNKFITFNNETYCLSEWAHKLNIDEQTLRNRFKSGWSIEDALTKNNKKAHRTENNSIWKNRENNFITFQNKTLRLCEWAKEINISRKTLSARLCNGWSIEKTLTEPVLIYSQKENKNV